MPLLMNTEHYIWTGMSAIWPLTASYNANTLEKIESSSLIIGIDRGVNLNCELKLFCNLTSNFE